MAPPPTDPEPPGATRTVWRRALAGGSREVREDRVVVEEPLEIRVEGRPVTVTMRTPGHDEELVAGLLLAEGVVDGADDLVAVRKIRDPLRPRDNTVDVRLASGVSPDRLVSARRDLYASSACGVCGKATLEAVLRDQPRLERPRRAAPEVLERLPERMGRAQAVFRRTGGLHAAALFTFAGELEVLREDVGRHNAVDKVLGWRLLRDAVPVDDRILLVSGRVGFEIVQKALAARVPVLAAVGAPSSLAVDLALRADMQLVGFLRPGGGQEYLPGPG